MIQTDKLKQLAAETGVPLGTKALSDFSLYAELLVDVNGRMNLTAITQPDEILEKHFLDSLELLRYVEVPQGAKVIDVGTGAGFPGVPLLIARNDLDLTLLDALQKRLHFLETVLDACSLQATLLHARAEDAGQDNCLRETFDLATARAVAPLNILAEYCLPFVRVGGTFAALKGTTEDFAAAENAVKVLGGEIEDIVSYKLPSGDGRTLVVIKKISQTPTPYPRKAKKMTQSPL